MDQLKLITSDDLPASDSADISLLGTLLDESRLYKSSEDYKALLEFVGAMKDFAPFNAMLLQIQKPGLRFAATARDWKEKFNRTINEE